LFHDHSNDYGEYNLDIVSIAYNAYRSSRGCFGASGQPRDLQTQHGRTEVNPVVFDFNESAKDQLNAGLPDWEVWYVRYATIRQVDWFARRRDNPDVKVSAYSPEELLRKISQAPTESTALPRRAPRCRPCMKTCSTCPLLRSF
jgi:hypothetical protein